MMLAEWARTWAVSDSALADLKARCLELDNVLPPGAPGLSEAAIQNRVRIEASAKGMRLWRNNVGVYHDPDKGVFVRYGLANDSKALNAVLKSGDLIGIRPYVVQRKDVGQLIGQFVSREVKHGGWRYSGTPREIAQLNWVNLINSMGGDAAFCTGEGSL